MILNKKIKVNKMNWNKKNKMKIKKKNNKKINHMNLFQVKQKKIKLYLKKIIMKVKMMNQIKV